MVVEPPISHQSCSKSLRNEIDPLERRRMSPLMLWGLVSVQKNIRPLVISSVHLAVGILFPSFIFGKVSSRIALSPISLSTGPIYMYTCTHTYTYIHTFKNIFSINDEKHPIKASVTYLDTRL